MKNRWTKCIFVIATIFFSQFAQAKDIDVIGRGALVNLTESSVTVGSLTCNVTSKTEFKNLSGEDILPSAFKTGDDVKLDCRGADAKEIELKASGGGNNGGGDNSCGCLNKKDKSKEIELNDKAEKVESVLTSASANLRYSYKRNEKGQTDVRFTVNAKIPVPGTVPLVSNSDGADDLSLSIILSRSGSAYANCTLAYDSLSPLKKSKQNAEYKLDIRQKRASLKTSKGDCDTSLTADGVQSGIPGAKKGDTYVISDSISGSFLQGKF